MWRSATDPFNELGWRFLNFFRIIEYITGKQRGGENRSRNMYYALPQKAKDLITEHDFVAIAENWGNPTAHGHMPNTVIPKTSHGEYDEHPDAYQLFNIVRILLREYIKK